MINRFLPMFRKDIESRFRILYGSGVEDQFIGQRNEICEFEQALFLALKENTYERIVFIAPHKPVYFLDLESKKLTLQRPIKPRVVEKAGGSDSLLNGPLGNINLLVEKTPQKAGGEHPGIGFDSTKDELHPFHNMGDNFAIRMLDDLMNKEDGIRTAVVIMQAETFLRFTTDQRSAVGLIGEWARKKSLNQNICCFVFSASSYEHLIDQVNLIPVPELRSLMISGPEATALVRIGYPQDDEITRLIEKYLRINRQEKDEEKLQSFKRSVLAEGGNIALWLQRLSQMKPGDGLESHFSEWFSHYLPGSKRADERLNELIGLDATKTFINKNIAMNKVLSSIPNSEKPNLHMMFVGNPGTGKTTVARLFGEIYFEAELLTRGHLVEVQAADLIADYEGGTALKTNSVIDQAMGGVLFVDEAYMLTENQRAGFASEALDTLLLRMENDRSAFIVIFAGYPEQMKRFRETNPGLTRRIPEENVIQFEDYTPEVLFKILEGMLDSKKFQLTEGSRDLLQEVITMLHRQRDSNFGNAGEMRNLVESIIRQWAFLHHENNVSPPFIINPEDIPEHYSSYVRQDVKISQLFTESFSDLIGLEAMKSHLRGYLYQIEYEQIKRDFAFSKERITPAHMVFYGSPGTGKTTVARKLGEIYRQTGLLRKGHCIEVSRADLVGGYVGQTAIKTTAVIESAMDGILFIDEAYSLAQGFQNDFGMEAINTLVKGMEDYRARVVIIFAGYEDEMIGFLNSNPGLASRVPHSIHFDDFSSQELGEILSLFAQQENFILSAHIIDAAVQKLNQNRRAVGNHFGNARAVRNLFQQMKTNLSTRVVQMDIALLRENPELLFRFEMDDLSEPRNSSGRFKSPQAKGSFLQVI